VRPQPQPRGPGQSPPSSVIAAHGISRRHCHCRRRCFRRRHRSLSFAGWLLRRCLHLSSSQLCLCFSTPINAPSPLVLWHLSSCLPLVHRLVVASSVIVCLHLVPPFVEQPRHASILDPPSLFAPAGCSVSRRRCSGRRRRRLRPSLSAAAPCCCARCAVVMRSDVALSPSPLLSLRQRRCFSRRRRPSSTAAPVAPPPLLTSSLSSKVASSAVAILDVVYVVVEGGIVTVPGVVVASFRPFSLLIV
jgi:hypothetical protein